MSIRRDPPMERVSLSVEPEQAAASIALAAALNFRQPGLYASMGNRAEFYRWLLQAYIEAPALVLAALDTIPRKERTP